MNMVAEPSFMSTEVKQAEAQGKKFWPRAGAYAVDVLAIYGTNLIITYGFGYIFGLLLAIIAPMIASNMYVADLDTRCINFIIGLFQSIAYFSVFEWLFGATIGKIIFGMRVISAEGGPCSFGQAVSRGLWRYIDGLFFGVVAYSEMKPPMFQRLGDKKASTLVVSSKDGFIKNNLPVSKFFLALAIYVVIECLIALISILMVIRFA